MKDLLALAQLLEGWSSRINLTGHRGLDGIVRRLILDAAAMVAQVPAPRTLVDLGAGAGFPGLPWAILHRGCSVTLVESRQRRHHFQRAVVRELGLERVRAELGRAEEIPAAPHEVVVAQAMARPEHVLMWMLRWAQPGGLLLIPGSETPPQVPENKGISASERVRYRVPCGGPDRTLWIGRRCCGTKEESP